MEVNVLLNNFAVKMKRVKGTREEGLYFKKNGVFLPFSIFLLTFSLPLQAAPWSGILSPSRATDWSQAGVTGGIPNRTTICATLNPGATAAQINSAIASCPNGQVVQLGAGSFNLASPIIISTSHVTLLGR